MGVVSSSGASKMIGAAKALSYQPSDNLVELQWFVDVISLASVMNEDAQVESTAEGFLNTLRVERDSDPGFFQMPGAGTGGKMWFHTYKVNELKEFHAKFEDYLAPTPRLCCRMLKMDIGNVEAFSSRRQIVLREVPRAG